MCSWGSFRGHHNDQGKANMSKLKDKDGYNVWQAGRPASIVKVLPEPATLCLPLVTPRFAFSRICAQDGARAAGGDILAEDPENFGIPLLAPRAGTVRMSAVDGHITLEDITQLEKRPRAAEKDMLHIQPPAGADDKRVKLLRLGAWQFIADAFTGRLPDPHGTPQAVIVSTLSLEPFVARGDVQLKRRLLNFTRGLEHLQSLLEYQPIYLVMPDITSPFARQVHEKIRGYAWVRLVEIPLRYGLEHPHVLARALGLSTEGGAVWSIKVEGVLAVDRALTLSRPCLVRTISIGGPCAKEPVHLDAMVGYPIADILSTYANHQEAMRVINGGMLTGKTLNGQLGLDAEARGLTLVPEPTEREFLGFTRPGFDRRSYSQCFLSTLRGRFTERITTGTRGEMRPCVSCNFCEEICPARIMPHLLHRYLYSDLITEAEQARIDLCVQCGLCSYVCPSKLELKQEFADAMELIHEEKEQLQRQEANE